MAAIFERVASRRGARLRHLVRFIPVHKLNREQRLWALWHASRYGTSEGVSVAPACPAVLLSGAPAPAADTLI